MTGVQTCALPISLVDSSGGDFARAVAERESWLSDAAIAAAYRRGGGHQRFGLPASRPERAGPFVVQRFQRYVFQHWIESVPGMPPRSSVVGALVGDYLKDAGLVSAEALVPPAHILPPVRLRVPAIGVDSTVVLADNDNLPRFRGVGWFIGSGFPGFRGNVVLFGHLNGVYETFGRLSELRPGDEIEVLTDERIHRYVVVGSRVVAADTVEVLAPATDKRLTLITCIGALDRKSVGEGKSVYIGGGRVL